MKQFLSLYLLLTALLSANTNDFSIIIKQPFDAALFDITENYDRTITAVGFSKEFKQNNSSKQTFTDAFEYLESLSSDYGPQMHLIKVSNSADIMLSKAAKLSRFNEALSVVKTPQNGYIIGGHTKDGELLVAKLNADAQFIYTKTFGTSQYEKLKEMILLSDGGVLLIGSSATSRSSSDDIFQSGLGKNDIYLTRLSSSGEKLWSQKYGTPHDDEGISATEASDGSIIVAARTSESQKEYITLLRTDENGAKLWLKNIQSKTLSIPTKIIKLKNGTFLLSIIEHNTAHKEHIRLMKIDLAGNILANKDIFTNYPSGLYDIKEFTNGTLIGVGYVRDNQNQDALAMQFAANLTLLNQEHYGDANYDTFYAAHILHNSQVAVAGLHTDPRSQESNMWIAKLNQNATMAKRSSLALGGDFYQKLRTLFKEEIAAKKLIVREDLSLEFLDPSLYFAQGSYKLTPPQKLFLQKFSRKLLPFLLREQKVIQRLEVNGHTSSEWKNTDFTQNYLNNAELSIERSFATMSYIFTQQNHETKKWLSMVLKQGGLSYSEKVMTSGIEEREKSRRVNFKIILK